MRGRSLCSLSYKLRNWLNGWSALALGLLAGYGGVTYLAAHPNVTDAYRAYYIDRTSSLSPVMREAQIDVLPAITIGQTYAHDAPELLLDGWDTPETMHTWTLGSHAQIILALPASLPPQTQELTLTLRGMYLTGAQRIIVHMEPSVARSDVIDRTYRDGEDLVVTFQSISGTKRIITLSLELPDAMLPRNGDPRVLAFALQSVEVAQTDH